MRILLAVESGSRAWGFPSPDSDYDIRFLFARPPDVYARLYPPRDVIEQPIVDEIDLNGWDVAKALKLGLASNATLSEWLDSPIVYRAEPTAVALLRGFADRVMSLHTLRHAYLSRTVAEMDKIATATRVRCKRYVYALRPALALRHMRRRESRPPMSLPDLMVETGLSDAEHAAIAALVAAKRDLAESADVARMPVLDALITDEIAAARAPAEATSGGKADVAVAEATFRAIVAPA